jgi:hypothetical protein
MSIVAPSAASSSNCFAPKAKPVSRPPALVAVIALNECYPLSLPFLRAAMGYLLRSEEPPPVALALPRVVPLAKYSASREIAKGPDRESIK